MRRYDAAYRAMKDGVDSGEIGSPLMMYSGHRNPEVPGALHQGDGHHRHGGA